MGGRKETAPCGGGDCARRKFSPALSLLGRSLTEGNPSIVENGELFSPRASPSVRNDSEIAVGLHHTNLALEGYAATVTSGN